MEGVDNWGVNLLKIMKVVSVVYDDVFKDDVVLVVVDGVIVVGLVYELNLMFFYIIEVNFGVGVLVVINDDGWVVDIINEVVFF